MTKRLLSGRLLVGLMWMSAGLAAGADVLAAQGGAAGADRVAPRAQPGERSPLVAAALQAVLPPLPLGYVYVGDLRRAVLPTGLMVGGSTVLVLEIVDLVDWTDDRGSETLLYVALVSVAVGYVYGIVDAADAARDHNARLRTSAVGLRVGPSPGRAGIELWVRLPSS